MIQSFQRDFGGASEAGVSTVVFMGGAGRTDWRTYAAGPSNCCAVRATWPAVQPQILRWLNKSAGAPTQTSRRRPVVNPFALHPGPPGAALRRRRCRGRAGARPSRWPSSQSSSSRDAARRQRDAGVRGAVVEVDRVAVGADRVAARERDVADVAVALVRRFGAEDPRRRRAARQRSGLLEIEQRERRAGRGSRPRCAGRRGRASASRAASRSAAARARPCSRPTIRRLRACSISLWPPQLRGRASTRSRCARRSRASDGG